MWDLPSLPLTWSGTNTSWLGELQGGETGWVCRSTWGKLWGGGEVSIGLSNNWFDCWMWVDDRHVLSWCPGCGRISHGHGILTSVVVKSDRFNEGIFLETEEVIGLPFG